MLVSRKGFGDFFLELVKLVGITPTGEGQESMGDGESKISLRPRDYSLIEWVYEVISQGPGKLSSCQTRRDL